MNILLESFFGFFFWTKFLVFQGVFCQGSHERNPYLMIFIFIYFSVLSINRIYQSIEQSIYPRHVMQNFHFILLLITEVVIISFITGFTSPSSLLRVAALPLVALCVCIAIHSRMPDTRAAQPTGSVGGGGGGGGGGGVYAINFLFQYISVALLSRWSFEDHGFFDGKSCFEKAQEIKTYCSEGCESKRQIGKKT